MTTSTAIISILAILLRAIPQPTGIEGAWTFQDPNGTKQVIIIADGHYALTSFGPAAKTFGSTRGGKYRLEGTKLVEVVEFNTVDPQQIGTEQTLFTVESKGGKVNLTAQGSNFTRLDDGTPGKLSGAWVITGRMGPDGMRKMTPGARRTMKILSGTRFQWIAYNVETKEFSGTGGGTYTTVDGKYTEQIEFFSRDNSRVGASLVFDFAIEGTAWRHKGLSSRGEAIDELWSRRSEVGL